VVSSAKTAPLNNAVLATIIKTLALFHAFTVFMSVLRVPYEFILSAALTRWSAAS